eukprot:1781876-Rhodomonas_salina.2
MAAAVLRAEGQGVQAQKAALGGAPGVDEVQKRVAALQREGARDAAPRLPGASANAVPGLASTRRTCDWPPNA